MKTTLRFALLALQLVAFKQVCYSQFTAEWTRDINSLPDSAYVFPVRTITDQLGYVYTLSAYSKTTMAGVLNEVYLFKYDSAGGLLWSLKYNNSGNGDPRGFDMAVDLSGNCYVAGGLMSMSKPMLLKVSSSGAVAWMRDSTTAFQVGWYDRVILQNNQLYLKSSMGLAKFDLNGIEDWSVNMSVGDYAVDSKGQVIFSAYLGNPNSIFRLDTNGAINFMDSSITAKRIAVDYLDNFYLFTDVPQYYLVKYDSSGNFQWSKNNYPMPTPFGDIGFDVLADYNLDVILVGIADTMYKYSAAGNLIWSKPMDGLDSYRLSSKITYSNFLLIGGSIPDSTGYNMKVALYDVNGNQTWWGFYNHDPDSQEFTVDVAMDQFGVYGLEDYNGNSTLVKFHSPAMDAIDYSLVCVDSVWYEPGNPNLVNISIFNGNMSHMNYPSVQIVSPTNDTISNEINFVNFFAHLGNTYQTYQDTITVQGITDFSNYTFLMNEGFGASTTVIGWCGTTGIEDYHHSGFNLYPNPVSDILNIFYESNGKPVDAEIFDCVGRKVYAQKLNADGLIQINVSDFPNGIYFAWLVDAEKIVTRKFIVQ